MSNYTQDYDYLQGVFDTLNTMIQQILTHYPRREHIAADMHALVTEALPVAERYGWRMTAVALNSYHVYWDSLVPEVEVQTA